MTTYRSEPFDGTTQAADFIRSYEALSVTWTEEEKIARFAQYLKRTSGSLARVYTERRYSEI
jgi:hypothetical protein